MLVDIKGSDGLVSIEVIDYERAVAETSEDANWLICYVTIKVAVFSAGYQSSFTTHDFLNFYGQLTATPEHSPRSAHFETMEDTLRINVDSHPNGEILVDGVAHTIGSPRSSLSFAFLSDRSRLSETVKQLQVIVNAYPVRA